MKLFQTTARFLVAATLLLSLGACDRDDDLFVRKSCGTYSGRLFVDEVLITEENLLNGVYYVSIRTAAFPLGELRAQIKF
ncbi:MAG: hypothetical protein LW624_03650 [Terrimonas sp.]|nr:hypothetical protein [Terrimonas sp.]